jgi:hypothetical protein
MSICLSRSLKGFLSNGERLINYFLPLEEERDSDEYGRQANTQEDVSVAEPTLPHCKDAKSANDGQFRVLADHYEVGVRLYLEYPEFPAALPRGLRFGKFENLRFSTILEA